MRSNSLRMGGYCTHTLAGLIGSQPSATAWMAIDTVSTVILKGPLRMTAALIGSNLISLA